MIEHASDLSRSTTLSADLCIIGSGPAGMTIALGLRNRGLSVVLLESGGFDVDAQTQALCEGESVGSSDPGLSSCRLRVFGGTSQHWTGWCRPLDETDMASWPISFDSLVPYYRRAQETLDLGDFVYDVRALSERTGLPALPLDPTRVSQVSYQFSPPTRFGEKYRARIEEAEDLRVILGATVLNIDATSGSVDGLDCSTAAGVTMRVEAQRYVVAGGGIENARLLLASGLGDPHWVGWGFTDHPHYYQAGFLILREDLDLRAFGSHWVDLGRRVSTLYALSIPRQLAIAEGIPPLSINLANDDFPEAAALSPDEIRPLMVDSLPGFVLRGLTVRMSQTPAAESRVGLSRTRDAFGMPLAAVGWNVPPSNLEGLLRAFEVIGAEIGRARLGRLWVPFSEDGSFDRPMIGGCHHVGTTRMSEASTDGVVDRNCRMHGIDNLFIGGSSVFRSPGYANPTLTICALAHRLADHLRAA